ncbi:hypothetical protein TNCV_4159661 [Trichonephila clavipes]|nr:hypothetical protein TNCV_4159661 [Trichonephila clavipes]
MHNAYEGDGDRAAYRHINRFEVKIYIKLEKLINFRFQIDTQGSFDIPHNMRAYDFHIQEIYRLQPEPNPQPLAYETGTLHLNHRAARKKH